MNDLLSSALFYRTFFCSVRRFAKIKKKGGDDSEQFKVDKKNQTC
jgi:hypothetical protein